MVKKKGIVMETSEAKIIVLTPQGEFLEVPWFQRDLPPQGSEIEFDVPAKKHILPRFKFDYIIYMAASILLLILVSIQFLGDFLPGTNRVVAYVTIDINPSIELGINYQGKVIEATGLNVDGERILQNINVLELVVDDAVTVITREAVKEQYLSPEKENNIVISVSGEEKRVVAQTKNLNYYAGKVLSENKLAGKAEVVEVPKEIHEKAKTLGVSQGKYVILLEALDQGLELSIDDVKGNSIIQAVKKAGGVPGELIAKAQKDKQLLKELELRHSKNVMARIENLKQTGKNSPKDKEANGDETDGKDTAKKTPLILEKRRPPGKAGNKGEDIREDIRKGLGKGSKNDQGPLQDNKHSNNDRKDKDDKEVNDAGAADNKSRNVDNGGNPNDYNGNANQGKNVKGFKERLNYIKKRLNLLYPANSGIFYGYLRRMDEIFVRFGRKDFLFVEERIIL